MKKLKISSPKFITIAKIADKIVPKVDILPAAKDQTDCAT